MSLQKQKLRKKLLAQRLAMSKPEVIEISHLINQKAIASIEWPKIKTMHIYTSLTPVNEIDTTDIQSYVTKNWPDILVTTSPARRDAVIPTDQFDLIIVPVLGFDKHNNRLGMGGGWYDRFLASQSKAETIGLAYSEALVKNMPKEKHDIAIDKIITNKNY